MTELNIKYKLLYIIIIKRRSNVIELHGNYIFDALDLFFDLNNDLDLESLLNDFGVGMSDLDPSIFDTE